MKRGSVLPFGAVAIDCACYDPRNGTTCTVQFQPEGVSNVESATQFCKAKTREICINEHGQVQASKYEGGLE